MRILNRSSLDSGFVSQLMWLILDVGVLYTWLRYNEGTLRKKLLLFFAAAIFMAAATLVADLWEYAAFGINLIMSIIFLFRLDSQMQPLISIALLKCIGTFAPTILNGILYRNLLILAIGGLCFIADLYYIYELYVNRNDT